MTRVSNEKEIVDYVRAARDAATPFEIVAAGTKRRAGKPMASREGKALPVLDVFGISGIVDYQPEELIVTVKPGTQLAELKAALAQKGQCLGFDPVDWTLFGPHGTLGGAVSCDASGSGRLRHGPARDSLLAFRGVNGLGEVFHGGAKVVKNVTGFDLPKLVCGAFGTLAVLTELSFRVFPRPGARATLILRDCDSERGFAALRVLWKSALEPSGLAYVPGGIKWPAPLGGLLGELGAGAALIRFEAASTPLQEKIAAAKALVDGRLEEIDGEMIFPLIGEGMVYKDSELDVWRVSLPPSEAARVAKMLGSPLWLGDWAGGLLWVGATGDEGPRVRAVAVEAGGHAMLLRAPAARRAALGVFPPKAKALSELAAAVRAAFDPNGLFNPGRL